MVLRLYLLSYRHGTLAIVISEVSGDSKLDAYSAVVKTFQFGRWGSNCLGEGRCGSRGARGELVRSPSEPHLLTHLIDDKAPTDRDGGDSPNTGAGACFKAATCVTVRPQLPQPRRVPPRVELVPDRRRIVVASRGLILGLAAA